MAFAAVGYESMSIGVTEDTLQGRVFLAARCQLLSYLGMAARTDLVVGGSWIVDLTRRVSRMTSHATGVVDKLGMGF